MFELPRPTICLEINIKDIVKSFNFKPWKWMS
jgi:hypothetical protein